MRISFGSDIDHFSKEEAFYLNLLLDLVWFKITKTSQNKVKLANVTLQIRFQGLLRWRLANISMW